MRKSLLGAVVLLSVAFSLILVPSQPEPPRTGNADCTAEGTVIDCYHRPLQ